MKSSCGKSPVKKPQTQINIVKELDLHGNSQFSFSKQKQTKEVNVA
jgi:hypothetical protein